MTLLGSTRSALACLRLVEEVFHPKNIPKIIFPSIIKMVFHWNMLARDSRKVSAYKIAVLLQPPFLLNLLSQKSASWQINIYWWFYYNEGVPVSGLRKSIRFILSDNRPFVSFSLPPSSAFPPWGTDRQFLAQPRPPRSWSVCCPTPEHCGWRCGVCWKTIGSALYLGEIIRFIKPWSPSGASLSQGGGVESQKPDWRAKLYHDLLRKNVYYIFIALLIKSSSLLLYSIPCSCELLYTRNCLFTTLYHSFIVGYKKKIHT